MRLRRLSGIITLFALTLAVCVPAPLAAGARPMRAARLVRPAVAADDSFPGVPLPGSGTKLSGQFTDTLNDLPATDPAADWDDYFRVALSEGDTFRVSITATGVPGVVADFYRSDTDPNPVSYTIGPESSEDTGYPQELWYTAGTAGTYYLDVYPYIQGALNATYTATWSITPAPISMKRLAGPTRYQTAIAISEAGYASGASPNVILATGTNFADALAASSLAGSYDCPILLTQGYTLTPGVREEIDRLRGSATANVMIMGSTSAVSKAVEDALVNGGGVKIKRVAGPTRYATAVEIAKEVKRHETVDLKHSWSGEAFVANGMNYPDALAASPLAAKRKMPILLVTPTSIPASSTTAFSTLGITKAYIVGGTPAVSSDVMSKLSVATKTRLSGINRYATAATLASYAEQWGWASAGTIGVATGLNFPDALGGGPLIGKMGGVMLLTAPDFLSDEPAGFIYTNRAKIANMRAFGSDFALKDGIFADFLDVLTGE